MDRQSLKDIRRKLNSLQFAQERGSYVLACRNFGVSKSSQYRWEAPGLTIFSSVNWTKPRSLAALPFSKLLVKSKSATVSSPLN